MARKKGIFTTIREIFEGGPDAEDEDDYEVYGYESRYDRRHDERYDDRYDTRYDEEPPQDEGIDLHGFEEERSKRRSNVYDFDKARGVSPIPEAETKVVIVQPTELRDATTACERLREGNICVVCVQTGDRIMDQRIADYLGGASYALEGNIERVNNHIFIMAPAHTKITRDLKEELKDSGLFAKFVARG